MSELVKSTSGALCSDQTCVLVPKTSLWASKLPNLTSPDSYLDLIFDLFKVFDIISGAGVACISHLAVRLTRFLVPDLQIRDQSTTLRVFIPTSIVARRDVTQQIDYHMFEQPHTCTWASGLNAIVQFGAMARIEHVDKRRRAAK